jgi:hypothetical protein
MEILPSSLLTQQNNACPIKQFFKITPKSQRAVEEEGVILKCKGADMVFIGVCCG